MKICEWKIHLMYLAYWTSQLSNTTVESQLLEKEAGAVLPVQEKSQTKKSQLYCMPITSTPPKGIDASWAPYVLQSKHPNEEALVFIL